MDFDFLKEYEENEISMSGTPLSERLSILKTPVFHAMQSSKSIWSQIAFSGTVIFPLFPISQHIFETLWGISVSEFPDIIKFVKETNKIQFVLIGNPTSFKEFDYLEPILKEFTPPTWYIYNKDDDQKKLEYLFSYSRDEIGVLIGISPIWKEVCRQTKYVNLIENLQTTYVYLRYYGFDDIADTFINNFLVDPDFAHMYNALASNLIITPIRDPFKANISLNIDTFDIANNMGLISKTSLNNLSFNEVGSYMMKKCTCRPESLEACKYMISQYEDNDLYKVNTALHSAIVNRNESKTLYNKNELGQILDNVWDDNKIKSNTMIINFGTDITIGAVGFCLGGVPGFLASLGVPILDHTGVIDKFSELIAKKIAQPYMATIYDFEKKYQIKKY